MDFFLTSQEPVHWNGNDLEGRPASILAGVKFLYAFMPRAFRKIQAFENSAESIYHDYHVHFQQPPLYFLHYALDVAYLVVCYLIKKIGFQIL